MANVLVYAETRGDNLRKVALETVTAARKLVDSSGGGEVHAIIAGPPGVASKAPAHGVPQARQWPEGERAQAVSSYQSRPISAAPQP